MADSIEQLGYELSIQTLGEQERSLSGLRARAGTVLAAASISGSFLGAKTSGGSLDAWSILALIAYVLVVATSIWVLLPHRYTFAFSGSPLLAESDREGGVDIAQGHRAAVLWMQPYIDENRDGIERLSTRFSASCVFLALEIVFWTISLA